MELNKIYNCDCRDGLKQLQDNFIDLTVTSCPYDNLRTYHDDEFAWNFDIFKEIANELYRVTKPGGVVVWVVGDEVVNGGETGTSFRQALYFQEIGFKIHDTMIYEKNSSTFPARINSKRYSQIFEYMFVFVKGKIRDDIKLIADKKNKWAGWTNWGTKTQYDVNGNLVSNKKNIKPTPEFSLRTNIWKYNVSFNDKTGHPAVFPEKLAEDHILSWSNEGDVVLDPFMGSGTTAKMAMLNKRNYIGFEKNTEYYEKSLERVGKYEGKVSDTPEFTTLKDAEGEFTVSSESEKEFNGKMELWDKLISPIDDMFNSTSLSILKTLTVTPAFKSKANDRRVAEVARERGLSGYTTEEPVLAEEIKNETELSSQNDSKTNTANAEIESPTKQLNYYREDKDAFIRDCVVVAPGRYKFKENCNDDEWLEERIKKVLEKYIENNEQFQKVFKTMKQLEEKPETQQETFDITPRDSAINVSAFLEEQEPAKRKYIYKENSKVRIVSGENSGIIGTVANHYYTDNGDISYVLIVGDEIINCPSSDVKIIRERRK